MILAPVSNQPKNDFSSIPNPKENIQALLNGPYLDLSQNAKIGLTAHNLNLLNVPKP